MYTGAAVITPHITNPALPSGNPTHAVSCGVSGNITCRFPGASADIVLPLVAGFIYEIAISHVRAAGTTATGLIAYW